MVNGYYEFFMELRGSHPSAGEKTMQDKANDMWTRMTVDQKNKYKNMAKKSKGDVKKLDSRGIPVDSIEETTKQNQLQEQESLEHIEKIVGSAKENGQLTSTTFSVIFTNYYCIDMKHKYVTCEVAVVQFSLEDGITDAYDSIINTVSIPQGFSSEAMNRSREHGIPLPPLQNCPDDLALILSNILATMNADRIVYCPKAYHNQINNFIEQWNGSNGPAISVYPLEKLFFELRNALTDAVGFPQMSLVGAELERDFFKYTSGMGCNFHATSEVYYNCALSVCKRWVFTICDYCCKHAGIQLLFGKHLPEKRQDVCQTELVPLKPSIPELTSYRYEPSKEVEEIIKEERWPTLDGRGSSTSQGAIPRQSAWGARNKNQTPSANSYAKAHDNDTPVDVSDDQQFPGLGERRHDNQPRRGGKSRGKKQ